MAESPSSERPRRLVFGEVAELYDRRRPGYPEALIDDLVARAGGGAGSGGDAERPSALEIGAGTGKATRQIAARGVAVLAIEPSPEMAAYARTATAGLGEVEIVVSDFERWQPHGRTFALVFAAQAWHWVDQRTGYAHARRALRPGGHLVVFWNRPAWGPSELRAELSDVYRRIVPELPADGPLHPDNDGVSIDEIHWPQAIAAADGLTDPGSRVYQWSLEFAPQEYVELLSTNSEIRLLDDRVRESLLDAVRGTIERHGARLPMPMITHASTARAVEIPS
jgi:SAM-dependent methyltransferase